MRERVLGRGNSLCEGEKLSPAASLERENNWVLIREEPRQGAPGLEGPGMPREGFWPLSRDRLAGW